MYSYSYSPSGVIKCSSLNDLRKLELAIKGIFRTSSSTYLYIQWIKGGNMRDGFLDIRTNVHRKTTSRLPNRKIKTQKNRNQRQNEKKPMMVSLLRGQVINKRQRKRKWKAKGGNYPPTVQNCKHKVMGSQTHHYRITIFLGYKLQMQKVKQEKEAYL